LENEKNTYFLSNGAKNAKVRSGSRNIERESEKIRILDRLEEDEGILRQERQNRVERRTIGRVEDHRESQKRQVSETVRLRSDRFSGGHFSKNEDDGARCLPSIWMRLD